MIAIFFDAPDEDLERNFGDSDNKAYNEINAELSSFGFKRLSNNFYISREEENGISNLYKAIRRLCTLEWFRKSITTINAFNIEDFSDFTRIVKF